MVHILWSSTHASHCQWCLFGYVNHVCPIIWLIRFFKCVTKNTETFRSQCILLLTGETQIIRFIHFRLEHFVFWLLCTTLWSLKITTPNYVQGKKNTLHNCIQYLQNKMVSIMTRSHSSREALGCGWRFESWICSSDKCADKCSATTYGCWTFSMNNMDLLKSLRDVQTPCLIYSIKNWVKRKMECNLLLES